jgi:hypothetical protein
MALAYAVIAILTIIYAHYVFQDRSKKINARYSGHFGKEAPGRR